MYFNAGAGAGAGSTCVRMCLPLTSIHKSNIGAVSRYRDIGCCAVYDFYVNRIPLLRRPTPSPLIWQSSSIQMANGFRFFYRNASLIGAISINIRLRIDQQSLRPLIWCGREGVCVCVWFSLASLYPSVECLAKCSQWQSY